MLISPLTDILTQQQIDLMPWWVWLIIIAFTLFAIFWYWINRHAYGYAAHGEHHDDAHSAPAASHAPDDLKKIEGIGPKVAAVLNKSGIHTFQQLSAARQGDLRKALDEAGYAYMNPASWPEQARLAAAGKWDELGRMQEALKGGRQN